MALTTVDAAIDRIYDFNDVEKDRELMARLIEIAEGELVRLCDREFEADKMRSEKLAAHNGRLYPRLLPINHVYGLTLDGEPVDYELDGEQVIISGGYRYGLYPFQRLYGESASAPEYTLTYSGGYAADQVPADLLRILDDLIQFFRVSRSQYAGVSVGPQTGAVRTRIRRHKSGVPAWIFDRLTKYKRRIPRAVSYGY